MMYCLTDSTAHFRRLLVNRKVPVVNFSKTASPSGEWVYQLTDDIRHRDVTLLASITPEPASLFDLLATFRLLKQSKSRQPRILLPYLSYQQQAVTSELVQELIRNLNPAELNLLEQDVPNLENAFLSKLRIEEPIDTILAIDQASAQFAKRFETLMKPTQAQKHILLAVHTLSDAKTFAHTIKELSAQGPLSIHVFVLHNLLDEVSLSKLERLPITTMMTTNSLSQPRQTVMQTIDITRHLITTP